MPPSTVGRRAGAGAMPRPARPTLGEVVRSPPGACDGVDCRAPVAGAGGTRNGVPGAVGGTATPRGGAGWAEEAPGTGSVLPPTTLGAEGTRGGAGTAKWTDSSGSCSSGKWLMTSCRSPVLGSGRGGLPVGSGSMRGDGAFSAFSAFDGGCEDAGGSTSGGAAIATAGLGVAASGEGGGALACDCGGGGTGRAGGYGGSPPIGAAAGLGIGTSGATGTGAGRGGAATAWGIGGGAGIPSTGRAGGYRGSPV